MQHLKLADFYNQEKTERERESKRVKKAKERLAHLVEGRDGVPNWRGPPEAHGIV